ncbi:glycosyltransferase family 8 protein [Helicobacter sp.]|uniref:glycosyltransferase family 8 protein n=1 Tax=Helicobacter sp. TaxID=218 RepID=UPI0025BEF143|nr:glycosyltransferase family 8 protein [Helicobacter sp.]MCI5969172.1 glycosyltransferase family 8 protein [Helicobacter sp.]
MLQKCGGGQNRQEGKYIFHILSDNITSKNQKRFQTLAKELSKTYPCEIFTYLVSDKEFQGYPKLHNSYTTYLRLKSASILPSDITTCLYLDTDILVLCDLRELFKTDLKGNLLAAVGDFNTDKTLPSRTSLSPYAFDKNAPYYNAGVMLLNLRKWRDENMESKALNFLKTYEVHYHDQDTINAIAKNQILTLNPKWNLGAFYALALEKNLAINLNCGEYFLPYTQETFKEALKNPAILHYLGNITPKPWESIYSKINPPLNSYTPFYHHSIQKWWEIALNTPEFSKDLIALKLQIEREDLQQYSNTLSKALQERDNFFLQKIQEIENVLYNHSHN